MALNLQQALKDNDPAGFMAAVRADPGHAQFANFDGAIEKALASGDRDLKTFAEQAQKSVLLAAQAEKIELADDGAGGIWNNLMQIVDDVLKGWNSGGWKGALGAFSFDKLTNIFQQSASGEQVTQLEQQAQAAAKAATTALRDSTHDAARTIRSEHGTDVASQTAKAIDDIKPG